MNAPNVQAPAPISLTAAVLALRKGLGLTQQQFANVLGMAISTVVRYESTRPPRGNALAKLYQLAVDHKLTHVAFMFHEAMITGLGAAASYKLGDVGANLALAINHLKYGSKEEAIELLESALKTVEEMDPYSSSSANDQEEPQ